MTLRLGFLASSRGSNMQAIIDACQSGLLDAEPVVVISNNASSGALARAKTEAIPAYHLSGKTHPDVQGLDQAIKETLARHQVELVVLAGYMKKLGPITLRAYQGRVINIHPALLPKHGGKGMYGIHIHEAVLAAGESETGITIHLVDDQYDTGAILAQRKVPVEEGDTAERLAARVLAVEHQFYVETLGKIITGEINLPGR